MAIKHHQRGSVRNLPCQGGIVEHRIDKPLGKFQGLSHTLSTDRVGVLTDIVIGLWVTQSAQGMPRWKSSRRVGQRSRPKLPPRLKITDARALSQPVGHPTDALRVLRAVDLATPTREQPVRSSLPRHRKQTDGSALDEICVPRHPGVGIPPRGNRRRTRAPARPLRHNAADGDTPSRGSRR